MSSKKILSPFIFPVLVISSLSLYSLKLVKYIQPLGLLTVVYILLSCLYFIFGVFLSFKIAKVKKTGKNSIQFEKRKTGVYFIWGLYLVSIIFFLIEYYVFYKKFGLLAPVLNSNYELLRLEFPINGYIHFLSMFNYIFLFILLYDIFFNENRYFYKVIVYFSLFFSTILGIGIGSRGIIFNFYAMLFFILIFKKKFSLKKLIFFGIIGIYLLGYMKYIRATSFSGENVNYSIQENWALSNVKVSYPLYYSYLAFTMSLSTLDRYVNRLSAHSYGYFTFFLPFYQLLPGHQYSLKDLQYDVLGIDFHGTIVATSFSIPYIDFSFFGVFIFFFFGLLEGFFYKFAIYNKKPHFILFYSYIHFRISFLGLYTYPFGAFYPIFYAISLFILTKLFYKKSIKTENN